KRAKGAKQAAAKQVAAPVNPALAGVPVGSAGIPGAALPGAATLPMGLGSTTSPGEGPQVNATNQSGLAAGANGANQSVTNRNEHTSDGRSLGVPPWMTYG